MGQEAKGDSTFMNAYEVGLEHSAILSASLGNLEIKLVFVIVL